MTCDEARIAVLTNEVNEYREQAIVCFEHHRMLRVERDSLERQAKSLTIQRDEIFDEYIVFMQQIALAAAPGTENEPLPTEDRLVTQVATLATERDCYREALERIANGDMHKGHVCDTCQIARKALDGEA